MFEYIEPDKKLGKIFEAAEEEIKAVAKKHGFSIKLVDNNKGTWYFTPK